MELSKFEMMLRIGETVAVEFKRCGNKIESDVYESVCSFLNRFGGDLFLGVLDDGTVVGVNEKSAADMVKNFISVISDPNLFTPTVYLSPEIMKDAEGRTVIHVHIPPSAEVHSYKKVVYDRVNDSDVKVRATGQIAQMYIRKQDIFTERKIFPYATIEDFRLDLLPRVRQMAVNHAAGEHPWKDMGDEELLKSAGFYGTDKATGQSGYNLAGLMLLGKDDVILNVCPAYITDALLRKVNVDRYDDREIVQTNLIESYDALMAFARKHLPDKFFLEDDKRVSLRNVIAREMISNVLMHREFTSSYMARFVIEKNRMYVENANRASGADCITPENLAPNPKNPIIASFFRTIGLADGLGSGTRNLFHYTKYYSGKEPELKEGDVFRIIVPLDDDYSYDYSLKNVTQKVEEKAAEVGLQTENVGGKVGEKTVDGSNKTPEVQDTHQDVRQDTRKNTVTLSTDNNNVITDNDSLDTDNNGKVTDNNDNNTDNGCRKAIKNSSLTDRQKMAVSLICENPAITVKEIAVKMDISWSSAHDLIKALCSKGCIARIGAKRNGHWELINR